MDQSFTLIFTPKGYDRRKRFLLAPEAAGKKIVFYVFITAALVVGILYCVIGQIYGVGVAIKENLEVLQWAEVLAQESLGKFEMIQLNLRLFLFLQPGDVMGGGLKPAATNRRK